MSSFQFKKFSVAQNSSAMKVGTDSVLLGAWSTIKEGNILDIGTGTGLIALMLAQRSKNSKIDAVEMELDASIEAITNANNSDWAEKITIHNCAIQDFEPTKKYNLIISNPPFFIDSTKSPISNRNSARHSDNLSFIDLIKSITLHLKYDGISSLILPTIEAEQFIKQAKQQNLHLNKKCIVKPNSIKPAKRILMEFSFNQTEIIHENLTIETETRHQYTKEYISLTREFYLNF